MSDATVSEAPKKAAGFLTKKLFGLPIVVWAAIVLILGYFLYRRYAGTSTPSTTTLADSTSTDSTDQGGDVQDVPDESADGVGTVGGGTGMGSGVVSTTDSYSTNSEWESAVETGLISAGLNASDVNNALATYMGGGELTAAQVQIINTAITEFGEPPSGALPINEVTAATSSVASTTGPTQTSGSTSGASSTGSAGTSPAKTTTPPKTTTKAPAKPKTTYSTYTIKHGDTYTKIAEKYYGSASSADIKALEDANPSEKSTDLHVGKSIKVPHQSGAMGHYKV